MWAWEGGAGEEGRGRGQGKRGRVGNGELGAESVEFMKRYPAIAALKVP